MCVSCVRSLWSCVLCGSVCCDSVVCATGVWLVCKSGRVFEVGVCCVHSCVCCDVVVADRIVGVVGFVGVVVWFMLAIVR